MDNIIQNIALYVLPVLFAITLHEAAHAYAARYFGDSTAHLLGRTSLNPVRHIDPIGTILLPLFILITSKVALGSGLLFGYAKPVPVYWSKLRNPKRDMLWVAAAGPAANLVMAVGWAIALKLMGQPVSQIGLFMHKMCIVGVSINISLMALNLLPIPPLDGGRIVYSLLPAQLAEPYSKIEPYGMWILIILLVTGVLGYLMQPLLGAGYALIQLLM